MGRRDKPGDDGVGLVRAISESTMALDADALKSQARAATGLSDFGDAPLDEGLSRFVAALNEREHEPRALAAAERTILGLLVERLRLEDWIGRHPEVLDEPIERPVFVTGLPRSGTTALSQFLSEDPAARSIRRWELLNAVPPPAKDPFGDPRIEATRKTFAARDAAMPDLSILLPVGAEDPSEHGMVLALTSLSFHLPMMHHAQAYQDWLLQADFRPAYRYMRRVLQVLQSRTGAPHWNLKNPNDIFSLDALVAEFPDARLVWCHRDPASSVPSNCSLLTMLRLNAGEQVDKIELGRTKLAVLADGVRRAMAARDRIGDSRFADVYQRELVEDTPGVVERLYARLGLPFSDAYRARLTNRVTERSDQLAGKAHRHELADFGLSLGGIRREFGDYIERFKPPRSA